MSVLFHFRTAWNDYFTGNATSTLSNAYETRETPSVTGVYVLNSLFKSITSTSNGGALYCSSSVKYLLIESTSFFTCKTSSGGGAIYFSNTGNGQCVLYKVCGNDCCTTSTSDYQFSYIYVQNIPSSKNYISYSSVSRCVNENSGSEYTMRNNYGKIYFPSINVSMNKCYCRSGIYCYPDSESNSITCSITYSTFADNNATGHSCLRLNSNGLKYEIKSCNIIRNTQVSLDTGGTINADANVTIDGSCILENKATYNFFIPSSSYTITLSNCTVDSTSSNRNIIIQNTVTKSFILALNHMSTRNCNSEYDSVGTLTPIASHFSPSNEQMHCRSCGRHFYQFSPQAFPLLISLYFSI
jgi:hypothetical protein